MKIPDNITKKDIMSQIKSLRILYRHYEKEIYNGCPLCRSSIKLAVLKEGSEWDDSYICGYCPWIWITGKKCGDFNKRWGIGHSEHRMKEIKQWIKKLEGVC